jgi:hypothetical protein
MYRDNPSKVNDLIERLGSIYPIGGKLPDKSVLIITEGDS